MHRLILLLTLVSPALCAFEGDNKQPYLTIEKIRLHKSLYDPEHNIRDIIIDQIAWLKGKRNIIKTKIDVRQQYIKEYVPAAGTQTVLVQFINTSGMPLLKPFHFNMAYYQEAESKIMDTCAINIIYKATDGSIIEEVEDITK